MLTHAQALVLIDLLLSRSLDQKNPLLPGWRPPVSEKLPPK